MEKKKNKGWDQLYYDAFCKNVSEEQLAINQQELIAFLNPRKK